MREQNVYQSLAVWGTKGLRYVPALIQPFESQMSGVLLQVVPAINEADISPRRS